MAIVFHCSCGRLLRTGVESAGKRTRCPGCEQIVTIPAASTVKAAVATPTGPALNEESLELDWAEFEKPHIGSNVVEFGRISSGVIKVDTAFDIAQPIEIPRTEDGSLQYHVMGHKELGITKFNAAKLEEILNAHARQGWSLKSAVVMNVHGHSGNHDELVVILER